jgi:hypothetical protein
MLWDSFVQNFAGVENRGFFNSTSTLPVRARATGYVSGLSFIDDPGKSVKAAAERTQARIEQGYNELASFLGKCAVSAAPFYFF